MYCVFPRLSASVGGELRMYVVQSGQGGVGDEMQTIPCLTNTGVGKKHTENALETCKYFLRVCICI